MRRSLVLLIMILGCSLIVSPPAHGKRPPRKGAVYLTDILQKAADLEEAGDQEAAEGVLLELLESTKKKHFRDESEWLSYMQVLREIIAFYYRQRDFKEADWHHRQYSHELEGDHEESGMQAMVVYDITDLAGDLIDGGKMEAAEEIFLYLKDRLEERFGYRHWLVRLVYKNITALYVKMGNQERAEEYGRKLNPEDP